MLKTIDTFKHEPIYIGNCSLVDIATMLRQQQNKIEALKADKALHDEAYLSQMKEIEALKGENRVLRKGELWLGMVYNNRGNGIAPMYLENFMYFCETNGFTEESGYKLFKEQ